MAFFENVGRSIKGMKDTVTEKTKDLTDITRLNNQIAAAEKQIDKLFGAVGRIYYENHKHDEAPEAAPQIDELNGLFARIAEAQESIKKIKGVGKCPNCGADVQPGAQFCSTCGQKIVQAPPAGTAGTCPSCGAPLEEGAAFCSNCGARIEADPMEATIVPEPAPKPASVCPSCGAPLEPDMLFCVNCGARVEKPAEAAKPDAYAQEMEPTQAPSDLQF